MEVVNHVEPEVLGQEVLGQGVLGQEALERGCLTAAAVGDTTAQARPEVRGEPRLRREDVLYSVRIPPDPGQISCPRCGTAFRAAGPTGYADAHPICDLCLLESCHALGMVLALVTVTRGFGQLERADEQLFWESLGSLGIFARIYERFAAQSGPARSFEVPRFDEEA